MSSPVTSLDVARRAGVSQSAVSRVFTPGASASKETQRKVREAADALGYRPNALARAMITGKSRIIGLVVAYLDNQFYPLALERLSNTLQERGYHVLIFTAPNAPTAIEGVMQDLLDYRVDGIVLASVAMTSDLAERCRDRDIPVVLFNRGQDDTRLSSVCSANVAGGQKVAEFLVAGGHNRIAHIAGWQGSSTGRDRARGLADGLAAHGMEIFAQVDGLYRHDAAAEATRALMGAATTPDAIFVGNDHMAFAVLDTLRSELGCAVPDDVSVVGYDDVPLAAWPAYRLTTVRQPVNRMVAATVETLLDQIEGTRRPARRIEIDGDLIVRTSARIPKEQDAP